MGKILIGGSGFNPAASQGHGDAVQRIVGDKCFGMEEPNMGRNSPDLFHC